VIPIDPIDRKMSATEPSLVHEAALYHLPPDGTAPSSISIEDLKLQGIEFIRIQWVDLINNIRYRVVPLEYFEKLLTSSRPGVSVTKASLGLVFITLAEGFGCVQTQLAFFRMMTYQWTRAFFFIRDSDRLENIFMLLIYHRFECVHTLLDMQVSWAGSRRKCPILVKKVIVQSRLTCAQEQF